MIAPRLGSSTVLALLTFVVSFAFSYGPDALRMSLPAALAISLAAAGAVWLSGTRPVVALVLVTVMAVALPALRSTFDVMELVVVLVVFQATLRARLPAGVLAAACLFALSVNEVWQRIAFERSFAEPSVLLPLLLTVLVVGLGLQSRRVLTQNADLRALRHVEEQRAVSEERRRIARDVHDIAAHHLSALVVHNKLARRVNSDEALREAADFTADTAGAALDSLRQVVTVLNAERDPPLVPQPRLDELAEIVARMRAAGLYVELTTEDVRVRRDVELAVVRIAQEAMANVLRHRGPGKCWVDLAQQGDRIELTVEDDGPATWPAASTAEQRAGFGVSGMRERAQACGGRLVVDESPRGGWLVRAVLPGSSA